MRKDLPGQMDRQTGQPPQHNDARHPRVENHRPCDASNDSMLDIASLTVTLILSKPIVPLLH